MRLWRFKSGSDTIIKLCCALLRSVKLCYALENVEISMPDRSKSWDILTKRVKWWQTVRFESSYAELCYALLSFDTPELGALINSWQNAQIF